MSVLHSAISVWPAHPSPAARDALELTHHALPAAAPESLPMAGHRVPGTARAAVALADWNDLLCAIQARLISSAGQGPASDAGAPKSLLQVQGAVLECAAALDHLHATLAAEIEDRRQLDLDLAEARLALDDARAELLGTQAVEVQARHLALHDELTALPNRNCFRARLDLALAPGRLNPSLDRALTVVYLDLNDFKRINDHHGHSVGDQVLKITAARLARAVRANDMVGRLGGDEFACLLAGMSDDAAISALAAKLLAKVAGPIRVGTLSVTVHASIGIACHPKDGVSAAELLDNADAAMFGAKRHRSGYEFFDRHTHA